MDAKRRAELDELPARIRQDQLRIDHRRGVPQQRSGFFEELGLLDKPDIAQAHGLALGGIGCKHARRVADQEDVPAGAHPVPPDLGDHVMRHCFW